MKQEEHDALLVEVQRLEAELGKVRQDLLGVLGCKGKCEQLATLQETVSTRGTGNYPVITVDKNQLSTYMSTTDSAEAEMKGNPLFDIFFTYIR